MDAKRVARALAATGAAAAALFLSGSCDPGVVVRMVTQVHADGSLARRLEVHDYHAPGGGGVALARRDAWSHATERSEEKVSILVADALFARAGDAPALLSYGASDGRVQDRARVELAIDDLVVLRRWRYRETYADPYGPEEAAAALDRLVALVGEALREELRRQFGENFDARAADALLHRELRPWLGRHYRELVGVLLADKDPVAQDRAARTLAALGLPVTDVRGDGFDDAEQRLVLLAARDRVAAALSTPERPVAPADLAFWPVASDDWSAIVRDTWPDEEEFNRSAGRIFDTLVGFFGGGFTRYRFAWQVEMPGQLVRTNGAVLGSTPEWFFRERDIAGGEHVMLAESVELDVEALRRLGARRTFEPRALLEILDILGGREADPRMLPLLRTALERHDLDVLRKTEGAPKYADDLADLLDPAVPPR